MKAETLMSLACARGVSLDAITRGGGKPEWTPADVGIALGGLYREATWAALYSLCGDLSVRGSLKWWLMEHLLMAREMHQWAGKVEQTDGRRVKFSERLVELFLIEEHEPAKFQASPVLRCVVMNVEPEAWRRVLSHQYAEVAAEYRHALVDAVDHLTRKLRRCA